MAAAVPAAISSTTEIHRIHKLPALATKLNQISEKGKEGFLATSTAKERRMNGKKWIYNARRAIETFHARAL